MVVSIFLKSISMLSIRLEDQRAQILMICNQKVLHDIENFLEDYHLEAKSIEFQLPHYKIP